MQIFEAVYENKAFIINAYIAVSREQIENYLFHLTHDLIMGVVLEQSIETSLSHAQKNFIADFYKYSFVGIMLDWICQGMKDDYTSICQNMCTTIHGNIQILIKNFTKSQSDKILLFAILSIEEPANGNTIGDRSRKYRSS